MRQGDAEAYHQRAWACLREANKDTHEGRRAILATAAITWETLANDLEARANRLIDDESSSVDEDEG